MVVLSSSPCYLFWLVPLPSQDQGDLREMMGWAILCLLWLPAPCCVLSLPYLTVFISVSLLLFAVWTERLDQSKSELQPACPSPASPPDFFLCTDFPTTQMFQTPLKPVKGPRIWNSKTGLQAYVGSPHAMWCWASLGISWGEVVFLYTISILVPTLQSVIWGVNFVNGGIIHKQCLLLPDCYCEWKV